METGVVTKRAWKRQRSLTVGGAEPEWIIELGDVVRQLNPADFVVKESIAEVTLTITRRFLLIMVSLVLCIFSPS